MKAKLLKISLVIATVVLVAGCVVFIAGGWFLIWVDGCVEMQMVPFTCQFLP